MSNDDIILNLISPKEGTVFVVADGSVIEDLPEKLEWLGFAATALYLNSSTGEGHSYGPYLVQCETEEQVHTIRAHFSADAVVWWQWPKEQDGAEWDKFYHHLRSIGKVEIPIYSHKTRRRSGPQVEAVIFRHYDPHVLAQVLPILDRRQQARIYGKALALVIDAQRAGGLRIARVPPDLPPPSPGLLRLSAANYDTLAEVTRADKDGQLAQRFRRDNGAEVAHMTDDDLRAEIRATRKMAQDLGIKDSRLRMRFIMLGVFRVPRFWEDETLGKLLYSRNGSADTRFGDVCALLKISAQRTGVENRVWW